MIYIHEGIVPESPGSKRNKLVGVHYFCRGTKQSNQDLWREIYDYIDATYDLEKVKKIYIHSDGGTWIKEGMKNIVGVKFILDEFHLSKYVSKMVRHMLDTKEDARSEVYKTIQYENKKTFVELANHLKEYTKDEGIIKRIEDGEKYILNNWTAAKAIVLISPMMEQDNKEGVSNDVKLKVEMELQNIEYFSPNLSMN